MPKDKFSYILKLLDISPSQMAKYLNVDRTLVSKWKNASRSISIKSVYFDKALEFLISKNNRLKINLLKNLFSSVYPEFDNSINDDNYLTNYLKRYLFDSSINTFNIEITQSNSIYTAPVKIYNEEKVELSEIISMLELAIKAHTYKKLYILFYNTIDLFLENESFRNKWIEKLLKLLDVGYELNLIYNYSNNPNIYVSLFPLLLNKNVSISILGQPSVIPNVNRFFFHILEDTFVFSSLRTGIDNNIKTYGSLFLDPITINFYILSVQNTLFRSKSLFYSINFYDILIGKYNIHSIINNHILRKNNFSYYYNLIPPLSVMSEDLYYDILCNTFKSKEEIKKHFSSFKLFKEHSHYQYSYSCSKLFFPVNNLIEMSKQDTVVYPQHFFIPSLSLSKSQFKRHINELVEYLLYRNNFLIYLCADDINCLSNSVPFWCKKNEFIIILNNDELEKGKISSDILFVNSVADFLEDYSLSLSENLKDKNIISEFLRNL